MLQDRMRISTCTCTLHALMFLQPPTARIPAAAHCWIYSSERIDCLQVAKEPSRAGILLEEECGRCPKFQPSDAHHCLIVSAVSRDGPHILCLGEQSNHHCASSGETILATMMKSFNIVHAFNFVHITRVINTFNHGGRA